MESRTESEKLDQSLAQIIETNNKKTNEEKLCYRCNKPGHFSRACPNKDPAESACYNCGKPGHLARDCRAPQADAACYSCGKPGHFAKDCLFSNDKCYSCGKFGHLARDCKANIESRCYTCGRVGHIARNCRSPPPFMNDACFTCGQRGHLARDCKSGHEVCYSCGKTGHIARECKNKPADTQRSTRVYVGNLSFETTSDDLLAHVKKSVTKDVSKCDVLCRPDGKSKGCAIVEFYNETDAEKAVTQLTDTELKGRKIFVREDREEKGFGTFDPKKMISGTGQGFFPQRTERRGGAGTYAAGCQLYVGNLPFNTGWQDLKDLCAEYGPVVRADVLDDRNKRYGTVRFANPQAAAKAIEALHDYEFKGRRIVVRLYDDKV